MQEQGGSYRLICNDFKVALYGLPDLSLDAIITDPPWEYSALSLYAPLAQLAYDKIKPGGDLLIVTGGMKDLDILAPINKLFNLKCRLTFLLEGSNQLVRPMMVIADQRPVYWFKKGKEQRPAMIKKTYFPLKKGGEKLHHPWGQPVELFDTVINVAGLQSKTICDPFLGGGSCGLASLKNGCYFIGIEVKRRWYNMSLSRMENSFPGV